MVQIQNLVSDYNQYIYKTINKTSNNIILKVLTQNKLSNSRPREFHKIENSYVKLRSAKLEQIRSGPS